MDKNTLYHFFAGNTTDAETLRVLAWMEESEENKKELFRERHLFDAIMLSHDDCVTGSPTGKVRQLKTYLPAFFRTAAVFAAAVILSYIFFHHPAATDTQIAMNTVSVPAGQRVNLTLSDGTNVWLNARTTFRYPGSFRTDGNREVYIDGEAYFDVSHDKEHPFVVNAGTYKVNVLGTSFNVSAYSDSELFETALMEGSVEIKSATDTNLHIALQPEQKVSVENGELAVSPITDYDIYRWKEGLICFKNDSFDHIVRELEKTFGTTIVVHNENVLQYVYTGKFRQSDGISHALRVLRLSIAFDFARDEEKNIIYIN